MPHEIASRLGCVIEPVGLALAQERKIVKSDELTWNDHPVFTFTRGIPGRASLVAASIDDISLTLELSFRTQMIGGQLSFSIGTFQDRCGVIVM